MKGNIPIAEIPHGEEIWLVVVVTSVRPRRTQQGRLFYEAAARNATGSLALKLWDETIGSGPALQPGLWGLTGRLEKFQERSQFLLSDYRPITAAQYREHQGADPYIPRAFTIDIETVALPAFRERTAAQLERTFRLGKMHLEQQQRYLEDIAAEEERSYQLGSLSAISGRVLAIAVHVGAIPGTNFPEQLPAGDQEHVFGIDAQGKEQAEQAALQAFLTLFKDFDCESDEIVGHNILGFDLPFIFQRCLVNKLVVRPFVRLGDFDVHGVFDTMRRWWFGDRRGRVSLDDLAWALGLETSKSEAVEGSKVFELYQRGQLLEIRQYNLRDVRLTRQVYERMVKYLGR